MRGWHGRAMAAVRAAVLVAAPAVVVPRDSTCWAGRGGGFDGRCGGFVGQQAAAPLPPRRQQWRRYRLAAARKNIERF